MTYLTVPISAKDTENVKEQIKCAVKAGADMLELRTDYLAGLNTGHIEQLVYYIKSEFPGAIKVIVTCRDEKEGGAQSLPIQLRVDVLKKAIGAGADFIDLEFENFSGSVREEVESALAGHQGTRLILSKHNFKARFADIKGLHRSIAGAMRGVIPKIVYTASQINDCFEGLDLLNRAGDDLIVFCMGQAGVMSRLLAKKLGGFLTFASLDDDSGTASGQITIEKIKKLYRWDSHNSQSEVFGVIADPVGHSMSPAIHNATLSNAGINGFYLPLLVQNRELGFNAFMDNVHARPWLDFRGFSVTIPHKQAALEYVWAKGGFIEGLTARIKSANTLLVTKAGMMCAYNTDYAGALDAIAKGMAVTREGLEGLTVAVIGAGGVSRAIVAGLADVGAKIKIYNRTKEKAQNLAQDFDCEWAGLDELDKLDAKLVVNCTSIGMSPNVDASPVPAEYLNENMTVFDTVYNPAETLLLKQAKEKGAKTIDGISMFVNQAMIQFRLFTNQKGDEELMRKVINENLM